MWGADLLALVVKALVDRPRPPAVLPEADPLLGGTVGASLPSGHAATSFAGAVILAILFRRGTWALLALAVLISFSRVYVGVHYPLDLLAGAALGVAVAAVPLLVTLRPLPRLSEALRRSGEAPPTG